MHIGTPLTTTRRRPAPVVYAAPCCTHGRAGLARRAPRRLPDEQVIGVTPFLLSGQFWEADGWPWMDTKMQDASSGPWKDTKAAGAGAADAEHTAQRRVRRAEPRPPVDVASKGAWAAGVGPAPAPLPQLVPRMIYTAMRALR